MGRPTLSNSENLNPEALSSFDMRPGLNYDISVLSKDGTLKFRTSESKGPLTETSCVQAGDCVDDAVGDAEASTSDNKEQPPRKREPQQHKKTAQIGERIFFWPQIEKTKNFLAFLFACCFIAGVNGTQPHCENVTRTLEQKLGDYVKVRLAAPANCHLHFFDPVRGQDKTICDVTACDSSLGYTIDEEGYLCFTASDETAGCYKLIEFHGNKVLDAILLKVLPKDPLTAGLETPKLDPPKSGAILNMPSELLVAVVFIVLGFLIL